MIDTSDSYVAVGDMAEFGLEISIFFHNFS